MKWSAPSRWDEVLFGRAVHARDDSPRTTSPSARRTYHAAAGTAHQHLLPGLDWPDIAQPLQRDDGRLRNGRSLLEGELGRLRRQCVLGGTRVFGEGSVATLREVSEDLITWPEPSDTRADRLDHSRHVGARGSDTWA